MPTKTKVISKVGTLEGMLQADLFRGITDITDVDVEKVRETLDGSLRDGEMDLGELTMYERSLFVHRKNLGFQLAEVMDQFPQLQGAMLAHVIFGIGNADSVFVGIPSDQVMRIEQLNDKKQWIDDVLRAFVMARLGDKIREVKSSGYRVYGNFRISTAHPCPRCGGFHD